MISVSSMPDGPDHPESWVFHLAMAWLGDPNHSLSYKERLEIIKEKARGLEEPARSAFTWIPDDTQVQKADISYWITEPWKNHNGLITLVGDAAHPMPPCKYTSLFNALRANIWAIDRGQGLNHCICDSNNLVEGIKRVRTGEISLAEAITAYDEEIVPRGREEVKCSMENALMLHDWEQVKQSPVFRDGFKPMSGHDKPAAAEAAKVPEADPSIGEQVDVPVAQPEESVARVEIASH